MGVLSSLMVLAGPLLLSVRIDGANQWCPRDLVLLMYLASSFTAATIVASLRPIRFIFNLSLVILSTASYVMCEVALDLAEPIRTVVCGAPVLLGLFVCLWLHPGIALLGRWAGLYALFGLALSPWAPGGQPVVELWERSGGSLDEFVNYLALGVVQTAIYMFFYRRAFQWYDVQPRP